MKVLLHIMRECRYGFVLLFVDNFSIAISNHEELTVVSRVYFYWLINVQRAQQITNIVIVSQKRKDKISHKQAAKDTHRLHSRSRPICLHNRRDRHSGIRYLYRSHCHTETVRGCTRLCRWMNWRLCFFGFILAAAVRCVTISERISKVSSESAFFGCMFGTIFFCLYKPNIVPGRNGK